MERSLYEETRSEFDSREYLFQNHHSRCKSGKFTRQRIWKLVRDASPDRKVWPHLFRHSFVSNLLQAGAPLDAVRLRLTRCVRQRLTQRVADLVGHSNVQTTLTIYSHTRVSEDVLRRVRI